MTDLNAILHAYQASLDCLNIVGDLLTKSTKRKSFHNTIFFSKSPNEAQKLLASSKEELSDSAIVSLLSAFEHIIFHHPASPLPKRTSDKKGHSGLNDAIKEFEGQISSRTFNDAKLLCRYRDWVAHGKRWEKPCSPDPANTHKCLTTFLKQAGLR